MPLLLKKRNISTPAADFEESKPQGILLKKRSIISPQDGFDQTYSQYSKKYKINPNPDDPKHFYDYRGLFRDTGGINPDASGHLPSKYKLEGHPRMVVDGINTKTGLNESQGKILTRKTEDPKSRLTIGQRLLTSKPAEKVMGTFLGKMTLPEAENISRQAKEDIVNFPKIIPALAPWTPVKEQEKALNSISSVLTRVPHSVLSGMLPPEGETRGQAAARSILNPSRVTPGYGAEQVGRRLPAPRPLESTQEGRVGKFLGTSPKMIPRILLTAGAGSLAELLSFELGSGFGGNRLVEGYRHAKLKGAAKEAEDLLDTATKEAVKKLDEKGFFPKDWTEADKMGRTKVALREKFFGSRAPGEILDPKTGEALLKRQTPGKILLRPLMGEAGEAKVPQFKSTQEAINFGKSIAGKAEMIQALQSLREASLKKSKELREAQDPTDDQLQAGLDEAVRGQFYREAIEAAEGKIKEIPKISEPVAPYGKKKATSVFYSKLEKTINEKMPNAATPDQIRGIIKNAGVKQEEIDWMDVEGFLEGKEKVSKQELADFIKQNEVSVEEKELESQGEDSKMLALEQKANEAKARISEIKREVGGNPYVAGSQRDKKLTWGIKKDSGEFESLPEKYQDELDDLAENIRSYENYEQSAAERGSMGETRFSNYQLPGGKNYKELLLKLPQKKKGGFVVKYDDKTQMYNAFDPNTNEKLSSEDTEKAAAEAASDLVDVGDKLFSSSHFDEPNVLVHVRFNERTDAEGKKVLFIEEIQSDWHQAGRKEGYVTRKLPEGWKIENNPGRGYSSWQIVDENGHPQYQGQTEEQAWEHYRTNQFNKSVPDAPFKKTWHELALKRMLRYAAEKGFDKIAWTTGEQQASRYDLSKQIDAIQYIPVSAGYYNIDVLKDGKKIEGLPSSMKEADIEQYLGKDIAKKIVEGQGEQVKGLMTKTLSGLDLKVGGEGMSGFYDQMIPSFLNKYAKKWGGKVGISKIKTDNAPQKVIDQYADQPDHPFTKRQFADVHSIDITPSMKQSVLGEGQQIFEKSPEYGTVKETQGELFNEKDGKEISSPEGKVDTQDPARPSPLRPAPIQVKFKKDGYLFFPKQKIQSPTDVAFAFKHLTNNAIESFFIVAEKKGRPASVELITTGTYNFASPSIYEFFSLLESEKADSIYLVHNHPSGIVKPSQEDKIFTSKAQDILEKAGIKFKGHIIIDSEEFGLIQPSGEHIILKHKEYAETKKVPMLKKYFEWSMKKDDFGPHIKSSRDVFEVIKGIKVSPNTAMVVTLNTQNRVMNVVPIPQGNINTGNLVKLVTNARAASVIVTNSGLHINPMAVESLQIDLRNANIKLLDVIDVSHGKTYRAMSENWQEQPIAESDPEYSSSDKADYELFMKDYLAAEKSLEAAVRKLGGIKPYKFAKEAEELKEIPSHLKNKNGMALDDMASELKSEGFNFEDGEELRQALIAMKGKPKFSVSQETKEYLAMARKNKTLVLKVGRMLGRMPTATQVKQNVRKFTGLKRETPIETTEEKLLRLSMRQQKKGAKFGYAAGKREIRGKIRLKRQEEISKRKPSFGSSWSREQRKELFKDAMAKGLIYKTEEGKLKTGRFRYLLRHFNGASFDELKQYIGNLTGDPQNPPLLLKISGDINQDTEIMQFLAKASQSWEDINRIEINSLDPVRIIEKVTGQDLWDDNILADNTFTVLAAADHAVLIEKVDQYSQLTKNAEGVVPDSKESAEIQRKFEAKEPLTEKEQRIANFLRSKYEMLIARMNEIRKELNRPLIPYRKDYMTHINELTMLEEFLKENPRNENINNAQLDAIRKGDYTKGNMPFNKFALKRKGELTKFDAIGNYKKYLDVALREIHYSPAIYHARKFIEYALIKQPNAYTAIDRLLNELKGKRAISDQNLIGDLANTKVVQWARRQLAKNALIGNINFWLTNLSNIATSSGELGRYTAIGMNKFLTNKEWRKMAFEKSMFLKGRSIDPDIDAQITDSFNEVMKHIQEGSVLKAGANATKIAERFFSSVTSFIEYNNVGGSWVGAYMKAIDKLGYDEETAVKYADSIARRTQTGYKKYEMPGWMRSKIGAILSQFQTWAFNSMNHLLYDMGLGNIPRNIMSKFGGKSAKPIRWADFLKLIITVMIVNAIYKKAGLREPFRPESAVPQVSGVYEGRFGKSGVFKLIDQGKQVFVAKKPETKIKNLTRMGTSVALPFGGAQVGRFMTGKILPENKETNGKFKSKFKDKFEGKFKSKF